MNNIFQEKRNVFLLLVGLLFVLLIVLYFAFLRPLIGELNGKESSLITLQEDINVLEAEITYQSDVIEEFSIDDILQQKKMPLTRELESLVLSLQEMELVSSSLIETIEFHYDSSLPETDFLKEPEEEEPDNSDSTIEADSDEGEAEPAIDLSEKPENSQIITVRMDVSSPNYKYFQQFITEIEKQERMMSISRLTFDKPAEKELIIEEEKNETMTYNVELITFYYEE